MLTLEQPICCMIENEYIYGLWTALRLRMHRCKPLAISMTQFPGLLIRRGSRFHALDPRVSHHENQHAQLFGNCTNIIEFNRHMYGYDVECSPALPLSGADATSTRPSLSQTVSVQRAVALARTTAPKYRLQNVSCGNGRCSIQ